MMIPLTARVGLAVLAGAGASVAGLDPSTLLGSILGINLAIFAIVLDHRGRLVSLEEAIDGG